MVAKFWTRMQPERRAKVLRFAKHALALSPLLYVLGACTPCFIGSGLVDTTPPVLWEEYDGPVLTLKEGNQTLYSEYCLPDKHGKNISEAGHYPAWCLGQDVLVYWSPDDTAIAIQAREGKPQWFSLKPFLNKKEGVAEIRATHGGILLNLFRNTEPNSFYPWQRRSPYLASGVITLDLATHKIRRLPDILAVKGDEQTDNYAILTAKHSLLIQDASGIEAGLPRETPIEQSPEGGGVSGWEYDPIGHRLAVMYTDKVVLYQGADQWVRRAGMIYQMYGVMLPPGAVWVMEPDMMSHQQNIAVLSSGGYFLGWRCSRNVGQASYAVPVDSTRLKILEKFEITTRQ